MKHYEERHGLRRLGRGASASMERDLKKNRAPSRAGNQRLVNLDASLECL